MTFPGKIAALPGRLRLRHHLLALVLAAVVPLLGVQAYVLYLDAVGAFKQARDTVVVRAARTAVVVQNLLDTSQELLNALAARPLIRAVDSARCDPILGEFSSLHPQYANIGVIDRAGRVICSAVPQPGGRFASVAQTEWFQRTLRENRPVLGNVFVGPITGKFVSVITHPLHDAAGTITGMLALPLDLVRLQPLMAGAALPPKAVIVITDAADTIAGRSLDSEKWVGTSARQLLVLDKARSMKQGHVTGYGVDGVERVYGFTTLHGNDWQVWSGMPTDIVYAGARRDALQSVLLSLAIVLAVAALMVAMIRVIERPVLQLAAAASAIAGGRAKARAPESGPLEIAEVARQFNLMLGSEADAQAHLRLSEERLRLATGAANVGLWDWDLATNAVFFSPEWKSQIGYRDAELASGYGEWESRLHPEDKPRVLALLNAHLENRAPAYETEFRLRHKDGSYRWIQVRGQVIRDAAGKGLRMLGTHVDITGQKLAFDETLRLLTEAQRARAALLNLLEDQARSAAALRQSEERYRNIIDLAEEGVWETDGNAVTTFVNRRMGEIFGHAPEEMIGRTIYDFMFEADIAAARAIQQRRREGVREQTEVRYRHQSGSEIWALVASTPKFDAQGRFAGAHGMLADITERKRAEEKIAAQLDELRRWFQAALGREDRVRQLKGEVNELRARLGEEVHYPSQEERPLTAPSPGVPVPDPTPGRPA